MFEYKNNLVKEIYWLRQLLVKAEETFGLKEKKRKKSVHLHTNTTLYSECDDNRSLPIWLFVNGAFSIKDAGDILTAHSHLNLSSNSV